MNTKRYHIIPLLLLIICFSFACEKKDTEPSSIFISPPQQKLLSFEFEKDKNEAYLSKTITGKVDNFGIHLYIPDSIKLSNLIATFDFKGEAVYVGSEKQISGKTAHDFTKNKTYVVLGEDNTKRRYPVFVVSTPELKSVVPEIILTTENGQKIKDRENYVKGHVRIDGKGVFQDYDGYMGIRGRGHSSWYMPKKPYKMKLNFPTSLLGLPGGKKWIFHNNYRGENKMLDGVAFKIARLLGMPYTPHVVPAEVTLNGKYEGLYSFIEQKEMGEGRIDIGKDGVLIQFDSYMDNPPWQFKSDIYDLPVTIHSPKLRKLPQSIAFDKLNQIKNDFEELENAVASSSFPNNNYLDYISDTSIVNFFIVFNFTANTDINGPSSTYMYQTKYGRYYMGPVWDFDGAFGYSYSQGKMFVKDDKPMIGEKDEPGTHFFKRFLLDPVIRALYKEKWADFKVNKYPQLISYIKRFGEVLENTGAYDRDYERWEEGKGSAKEATQALLDWLDRRVGYMDNYVAEW